jgi:hypothetical protein
VLGVGLGFDVVCGLFVHEGSVAQHKRFNRSEQRERGELARRRQRGTSQKNLSLIPNYLQKLRQGILGLPPHHFFPFCVAKHCQSIAFAKRISPASFPLIWRARALSPAATCMATKSVKKTCSRTSNQSLLARPLCCRRTSGDAWLASSGNRTETHGNLR